MFMQFHPNVKYSLNKKSRVVYTEKYLNNILHSFYSETLQQRYKVQPLKKLFKLFYFLLLENSFLLMRLYMIRGLSKLFELNKLIIILFFLNLIKYKANKCLQLIKYSPYIQQLIFPCTFVLFAAYRT